jgi:tetratricopeptide (TPR) repeat protein
MTGTSSLRSMLAVGTALLMLSGCAAGHQAKREELASAHFRLGDAELRKGRGLESEMNRRRAYPEFIKAVDMDPDNPLYRVALGNVLLFNGDMEGAEKQFRRALKSDPDYSMARQNLGQIYLSKGKYAEAIVEFDRALNNYAYAHPETAYYNKGRAYYLLGDCLKAAEAFKGALKIIPSFEGAWFQLGLCQEKEGLLDEAGESFKRALALLPESAPSHYYLGLVLFRQKNRDAAVIEFRKVVELAPKSDLGKNAARYLSILE